jgi:hypothetical protein
MEKELRFIFDSQFFFQNLKIIINLLHNEKRLYVEYLNVLLKILLMSLG